MSNNYVLKLAICVLSIFTCIRASAIEKNAPSFTASRRRITVGKPHVRIKATGNSKLHRPYIGSFATQNFGELKEIDSSAMAALEAMEEENWMRGPVHAECHGKPQGGFLALKEPVSCSQDGEEGKEKAFYFPQFGVSSVYEDDSSVESTGCDQAHTSRARTRSAAVFPRRISPRRASSREAFPRKASSTPTSPVKASSRPSPPEAGMPRPHSSGEDITKAIDQHRQQQHSPKEERETKARRKKKEPLVSRAPATTSFFSDTDDVESSAGSCGDADVAIPLLSDQQATTLSSSKTVREVDYSERTTTRPFQRSSSAECLKRSGSTECGERKIPMESSPRQEDQPVGYITDGELRGRPTDRYSIRNRASLPEENRNHDGDHTRHRASLLEPIPTTGRNNTSNGRRNRTTEHAKLSSIITSPPRQEDKQSGHLKERQYQSKSTEHCSTRNGANGTDHRNRVRTCLPGSNGHHPIDRSPICDRASLPESNQDRDSHQSTDQSHLCDKAGVPVNNQNRDGHYSIDRSPHHERRTSSTKRGNRNSVMESPPRQENQPLVHIKDRDHQGRSNERQFTSNGADLTDHRYHGRTSLIERTTTAGRTNTSTVGRASSEKHTHTPQRVERSQRHIPTPQKNIQVAGAKRTNLAENLYSGHRKRNPDEWVGSGANLTRDAKNPETANKERLGELHRRDEKMRQDEKYVGDRSKSQLDGQQSDMKEKNAGTRHSSLNQKVDEKLSDKHRRINIQTTAKSVIQRELTAKGNVDAQRNTPPQDQRRRA